MVHNRSGRAIRHAIAGCILVLTAVSYQQVAHAQLSTSNAFVVGTVQPGTGTIQVLIPPGLYTSPSLDFNTHSYFSASIAGTIFTNDDEAIAPAGRIPLGQPDLFLKIGDTVRTVWANRNGVDIIQDIYPYAFARAGQIIIRWTFRNRNPATVIPIQCQWLNDVEITDPRDTLSFLQSRGIGSSTIRTSTDTPPFLTNVNYSIKTESFTQASDVFPRFYMCPRFDLPGPRSGPGLTGLGYLDEPSIGTTKPSRVTMGDWPTLREVAWGPNPAQLMGTIFSDDDAILIEFPPTSVGATPVVGGCTTYGTSDWYTCQGTMFGLVKYPDFIAFDHSTEKYVPTPFRVDFLPVNYVMPSGPAAQNMRFSLTVGPHLSIVDSAMTIDYGNTRSLPSLADPGMLMPAGDVRELSWWVKADPVYYCKDNFISELKIAGSGNYDPPIYRDDYNQSSDTCEHPIVLECAETDTLPPLHDVVADNLVPKTMTMTVHDDRKLPIRDRGLDSVWWQPQPGHDAHVSNFAITLLDPIKPCFSDTLKHRLVVTQLDSTLDGCFRFYFLDCMGNLSDTTLCFDAHRLAVINDTLPPIIHSTLQLHGSGDQPCNVLFDSLIATEIRQYDAGIDSIYIFGTPSNVLVNPVAQYFANPATEARLGIRVVDSMMDADVCIRVVDAANPSNHTDTCFHYCTTADTFAPIVRITPVGTSTGMWDVEVTETRPWDRLIDSVFVFYDPTKFAFAPTGFPPINAVTRNQSQVTFRVVALDTTSSASFCVMANDLARNYSDTVCAGYGIEEDMLAPNIVFVGDPSINASSMEFGGNDIHFVGSPSNPIRYVWDKGLDSVWFTNVHGINIPWQSRRLFCVDSMLHFTLSVVDTAALDTTNACVTINVIDCAGNLTSQDWCYRYSRDSFPPLLRAQYLSKQTIGVTVTDDRPADRGNERIRTRAEQNLDHADLSAPMQPSTSMIVNRTDASRSSFGVVTTTDHWGSVFIADAAAHSASADLFVRIQDLAMSRGAITRYGSTIDIPIRFVYNDDVPIVEKGITAVSFSFAPRSVTGHLQFIGVRTLGTAMENGWQVDTLSKGLSHIVTAQLLPGGSPLSSPPDTMLFLRFAAVGSDTSEDITIDVDAINGETVVYNNGLDTVLYGANAVSIMPPPWGSLTGSRVIVSSICAPILAAGMRTPLSASLDEPYPNPSTTVATLHYTLGHEAPITLALYDLLGRRLRTIVADTRAQGAHSVTVDLADLHTGQYVLRLSTPNATRTTMMLVRK